MMCVNRSSTAFRISVLLLTVVSALALTPLQAQNKQVDNALLWKVTGNSLLKPSFLYGTIHLQDKRVFNFSDSLYNFLQLADGFAMEIHPDSVISALMAKQDEEMQDKLLSKHLKKDDFEQLSRKLKKDLGIDAKGLTLKDAYMLKDHLSKPEPKPDDMPTFVDAYLFGMARNQGKEIVGLEKASDQVKMLDDIRGEFDVKAILKGLKKEKSLIERLIQLYIQEDLRGIHDLMSYLPDDTEDKLLTLRNHLMAAKMDSLIRSKSFVVAVGTAHLPGDKGMIALLRKKGYTVEPVYTTSRTHANDYSIKALQKQQWVEVKEPKLGYSTRMPGKPSPMSMLNGGMKMNMYMDLTSMKLYYSAFLVPAVTVTARNADSLLKAMSTNTMLSSKGKSISSKRFKKDGFEGIDFVYRQAAENMFVRVQALAKDKRIYLVGFGTPKQEDISGKEAGDFFDAFKIEDMPSQPWETHSFKDQFFSISFPEEPKMNVLPVTDSSVRSVQFNSMDNNKGSYYGVTVVTTNPGYAIPDDSAYLASAVERLQDNIEMHNFSMQDTSFNGFRAKKVRASLKEDLWLNSMIVNRGNRIYTLLIICNREDSSSDAINDFFGSMTFLDYPKLQWKDRQLPEYSFTVPVTGTFSKIVFLDEDSTIATARRMYQWTAYDSASATSFFITRRKLSPHTWVKHDSVLLIKYMRDLLEKNETLLGYKMVRNGNSSGLEFSVNKRNSSLVQRIRVLLNDSAIYLLQADVPEQYWPQYDFQHFLDGFRFAKEVKPDFLYTNSFEKFLSSLRSSDSATYTAAYEAIEDLIIDSSDLKTLLKGASQEYASDSIEYSSVSEKLLELAEKIEHNRFNEIVEEHYNSLQPLQEQFKYNILATLAKKQTAASYALIEKLLKKGLPVKGDAHSFAYALQDSVELLTNFYPWLITLSNDSILGNLLFNVHVIALDSGVVKLQEFKSRESILLSAAKDELKRITDNKEESYYSAGMYRMMDLLGRLDSEDGYSLLKQFAGVKYINVKYVAVVQLLKSHQKVDARLLNQIAADTSYRTDLYDVLKEVNQEKLFPVKYFTQRAFAESYLYNSMEDIPSKMVFVGEKTAMFKGKKQKFLLYKCTFEYDDEEPTTYLCIAGPFSVDGKLVPLSEDENVSGMYYDEEFRQSLIDKHFKAYLSSLEEGSE